MPNTELDTWVTSIVIVLSLVAAGSIAWRRSRAAQEAPPSRLLRIFCSTAAFSITMVMALAAEEALNRGVSWRTLPLMAMAAVAFIAIGVVLFGIADFWLNLFKPRLVRRWLAIAVLAFGLFFCFCLVVAFWVAGEAGALVQPDILQMIGIGAVAGIVWWSYLPPPDANVAQLFE
jgi:hypothetical protein